MSLLYKKEEKIEKESADPLLISIADEEAFEKADCRLLIYGQETNGWGTKNGVEDVESICNEYDIFFNSCKCYHDGGQFWNGVKRFNSLLEKKLFDRKIFLIWNNIIKIGKNCSENNKEKCKGRPQQHIYNVEREFFPVIKEELILIKPNIVLFFTGPNYDDVIKDNFGTLKYEAVEPFSERQLSRVSLNNIPFVFRTYHPNYLWRHKIENYFNAIINKIEL